MFIHSFILPNSSLRPMTRRVDFAFSLDNNHNHKNHNDNDNDNNPHLNFLKGTVLGDKEQGVEIRDKGQEIMVNT